MFGVQNTYFYLLFLGCLRGIIEKTISEFPGKEAQKQVMIEAIMSSHEGRRLSFHLLTIGSKFLVCLNAVYVISDPKSCRFLRTERN